jgi:endonuclease YncB( thermonuclease family)
MSSKAIQWLSPATQSRAFSGVPRKRARPVTRNIELEMIVNGWAWVAEQYTFDRENEYFAAQDDARRDRRGLWAMDNPEPPWSFKRRQRRCSKAFEGQGQLI